MPRSLSVIDNPFISGLPRVRIALLDDSNDGENLRFSACSTQQRFWWSFVNLGDKKKSGGLLVGDRFDMKSFSTAKCRRRWIWMPRNLETDFSVVPWACNYQALSHGVLRVLGIHFRPTFWFSGWCSTNDSHFIARWSTMIWVSIMDMKDFRQGDMATSDHAMSIFQLMIHVVSIP